MRTKKDCGILTFTYVYDGSQLVEMTFYNDLFKFTYDAGGAPLTVDYNGTVYYYVTNLQGDVTEIRNANRQVVVTYRYDAWGKVLSVTGSMASTLGQRNPLRYRGYVYDQETYLYYLQSRYYDPEWGRFINADGLVTTGQGFVGNNMFAYCGNSPISRVDPTGLAWYSQALCWFVNFLGFFTRSFNNQGAINSVKNKHSDEDPSTSTYNKIINDQNGTTGSQFAYGDQSAQYNACAPIAVHNAKVLMGVDSTLSDTFDDFVDAGALIGNGTFGSNPYLIGDVLKNNNIPFTKINSATEINATGIYVIAYWNNGSFVNGSHVVAVQVDGANFSTYNYAGHGNVYHGLPYSYAQAFIVGYYLG